MARQRAGRSWPIGALWLRAAGLGLARLQMRARPAVRAAFLALPLLSLLLLLGPVHAQAPAIKGDASFAAAGGFARLIFKLDEDLDSEVVMAGSILIVRFKQPVDIPVEKLNDAVPDYVSSVRRDPDGTAIRFALTRKVTVNSMTAGERIFVDLLPDSWAGAPPSLPLEVVRELAERARAAERLLRQQKFAAEAKKRPPVRVRASIQPTFVRFVFELPAGTGVSSSLEDKKLSLVFASPLMFDLTDAKVAAPSNISAIEQAIEGESATVSFRVLGDADVHSFREDTNYVVDIGFDQARKPSQLPGAKSEAKPGAGAKPAAELPTPDKKVAATAPAAAETVMEQVKAAAGSAPSAPPASSRASAPVMPPAAVSASAPMAPSPQGAEAKDVPGTSRPPEPVQHAAASPPAETSAPPRDGAVTVAAKRSSDGLRLVFPFRQISPVAMFRRGATVWLVFDDASPINTDAIRREGGSVIGDVTTQKLPAGQAIRIRLGRPELASLSSDGSALTVTLADTVEAPSQPLSAVRNVTDPVRSHVAVTLANPGMVHRLTDPEAGDALTVVTAPLPAQGFVKRQDFVEFSLLESIHGIVVQSNADDLSITTSPERVVLSRPGGLTLSSAELTPERVTSSGPRPIFDVVAWRDNRNAVFNKRLDELVAAAARANGDDKLSANIDLARFYLARGFYPEAKGVMDLVLADAKPGTEDPAALIVRSAASILSGHAEEGLKDLANPTIGSNYDVQVWKGLAYATQNKWPEAREKFKNAEFSIAALPKDLQRVVLATAMRASLEVKDYAGASARGNDLNVIGVPAEMKPAVMVMQARLAEALGRDKDALSSYRDVVASGNDAAAAEARLHEIMLRQKHNEISPEDALHGLEVLSVVWRGDSIEVETLAQLAKLYAASNQYAASFAAARLATRLSPNSDISRPMQDDTSALFSEVFLGPKGDALPPIEALGLFYDYRELTPIGRRGDELIRRLSERLVGVDLLDQAADLLQYQVDHRLEGAARAQVASRLATVYLMNRKPDRAATVLRATRIADLAGEMRQQRLLLEARAQSDLGRHDLALDIISNLTGREVVRLRSDIYWAARRWQQSAEQIELYYGERWKDFQPLTAQEKGDVIRAAIGYALAEDGLGLARFREKFGPKMSGTDRVAFDIASKPATASNAEFTQIAKMAAAVDTLDGFLREMKARFPETVAKVGSPSDPTTTGSLPKIEAMQSANAL
jgi:hypothetical protein